MSQFRLAHFGLVLAAIGFTMAPPLVGLAPLAHAASSVSPEVGKHLQAATELIKKQKFKEAMAQVHDADNAGGKSANDNYTIESMRAYLANAMGDRPQAIRSYEMLLASGKAPASEQIKFIQAIAGLYYSQKDYPKAITWINRYLKEGGDDPKMRSLLTQTYFLNNDCARVSKEIQGELRAADKSGRALGEEQLQLLANCADKQSDKATYVNAIEKLVASYPKKSYWADLLNRVKGKPGFSTRLELDVSRLKLAIGQLQGTDNYMEMSQLALAANAPAEAQKIVEQGYKTGVFGTGPNAERQKRLRDFADKTAAEALKKMPTAEADAIKAKDGDTMAGLAYAYATIGQFDKAISLMQQALATGGLKHPDEAKLHQGLIYLQAGKKTEAIKSLKSVQGDDGAADLARYWVLQTNHPIN